MKKYITLFAAAMLTVFACKPVSPDPKPEPEPTPQPEKPEIKDEWEPSNCMAYVTVVDGKEKLVKKVEMKSAASFVSSAGFYTLYFADIPGLSKELLTSDEYSFPDNCNVFGISVMSPLLNQKVDINTETMHWMLGANFLSVIHFGIDDINKDEAITGGHLEFDIDKEKNEAHAEAKLELASGGYLWFSCNCDYTPGGENDSVFQWGDFSRPVRAAFYEETGLADAPLAMYLSSGEIEWGEDLERTTYLGVLPSKALCDGKSHDIADSIKSGDLEIMVRDFNSEWFITSGNIMIKEIAQYEYEIVVSGAKAVDMYEEMEDTTLDVVFQGTLKDLSIQRPIDNKFTYNNKDYTIKSCVVDLSSEVAEVYMLQAEGITTVAAAKEADPLIIRISASKWGTSVGLSTDKEVFCVSYDGNTWNKDNLDTGSFICHEYNPQTGLLHCQLANIYPLHSSKTAIKMEYKGTPVYIK
ncbi:MAG: hypothetical protein MJY92_01155 [Bacteroidales bacterium]|nr:hypothetical protein [Bacteroidales bacterium]